MALSSERILMNCHQRIRHHHHHHQRHYELRWRQKEEPQRVVAAVADNTGIWFRRRWSCDVTTLTTNDTRPMLYSNLLTDITSSPHQQQQQQQLRRFVPTTSSESYYETSSTTPQRRYLSTNSSVMTRQNSSFRPNHHNVFMNNNNCYTLNQCHRQQQQQRRHIVSWLPEALQSLTIWGGSGYMLKSLHTTFQLPYWACFVAISISVRTMLFPLVVYAAKNSARFAKIAPDVQFQLALFQKDMAHFRAMKATTKQFAFLMKINLQTLGATYKIHKVNPLTVFLSPLLQMPIFWYISVDMRKIVNGLDPLLAQRLVESNFAWVPDLTEADPWFGLPVIAGVLLYGNMEVALGKRNMAGEATSKADTAILFKDIFQSLAVFMPCFTAQLPAGVQVYIVTSFCYTFVQSIALRTESFRKLVGLPSMLTKPGPGRFTSEMIALKSLEQKARELRGDGPVLGTGVLAHGWEVSFAGKYRPSTIQGSLSDGVESNSKQQQSTPLIPFRIQTTVTPHEGIQIPAVAVDKSSWTSAVSSSTYIHGISAPLWQIQQQQEEMAAVDARTTVSKDSDTKNNNLDDREYMVHHTDDVMELANRGERKPMIVSKPIRGVPYKPLSSTTTKINSKKGPLRQKKPLLPVVKSKKRR